jgi:hypothetical protein
MALNDVPQPGQTLGGTQNPIRQNFLTIEDAFIVDHVDYGASLQGEHLKVTFTTQPDNPLPTIASNQFVMYNTTPTIADNAAYPVTLTSNELCILRQSTGNSIPITASVGNATAGWSYLPSGILMKWGTITGSYANGTWQQFTLPTGAGIPVFNNVFTINLQSVSQDTPPGAQTQTYNYLTVASNFTTTYFWWIPRTNFGNVNQTQLTYFIIGN